MDGTVVQRWRVGCALASILLGSACTDASTSPATGTSATTDVQAKPMTAMQAAVDIAITDLHVGQPIGGYLATAINDAGWIAGVGTSDSRAESAFLWKPGTGLVYLTAPAGYPTSQAWGINNVGDVVGQSRFDPNSSNAHATLWRGGSAIDLGVLGPNGDFSRYSRANDINDAGVIVGDAEPSVGTSTRLGFRWTPLTGMVALPVPANTRISEARAINSAGQIVGVIQGSGPTDLERAVLWNGSAIVELGLLPGASASVANDINAHGVVVGRMSFPSAPDHGFVWTQGAGLKDLGVLPGSLPAGIRSEALGINDNGDIVGASAVTSTYEPAVLWRNGESFALPSLTTGREVGVARAINNAGQIVGRVDVITVGTTRTHAVLWTISSNRAPTANPGGPYQGRKKKEAIAFDGRQSSDPDGDPLTFVWDFGDDSPTATGATTSHVYDKMGHYTVKLTVSDGRGGTSTAMTTVDILPPGKLDP
jgi:probable HAF family extracellular repeat protein